MEYCEQHTECATKIQEAMDSSKSAHRRIDGIVSDNKILLEMNANIKVLATNYENQGKEIGLIQADLKDLKNKPSPQETLINQGKDIIELKADVKELKEKPGKRWDTLQTVIITALASGFIGFILSRIFK